MNRHQVTAEQRRVVVRSAPPKLLTSAFATALAIAGHPPRRRWRVGTQCSVRWRGPLCGDPGRPVWVDTRVAVAWGWSCRLPATPATWARGDEPTFRVRTGFSLYRAPALVCVRKNRTYRQSEDNARPRQLLAVRTGEPRGRSSCRSLRGSG